LPVTSRPTGWLLVENENKKSERWHEWPEGERGLAEKSCLRDRKHYFCPVHCIKDIVWMECDDSSKRETVEDKIPDVQPAKYALDAG